jgi:hypothetical protein
MGAAREGPASVGTLAVILGAGDFTFAGLGINAAFSRSAAAFRTYLTAPKGLKLPSDHVLDLFDSEFAPEGQGKQIVTFLRKNATAENLIIYYVGHGGFLPDRDYFLTLRSTETDSEAFTALRAKALALAIDAWFPSKRVYLILDCCFAGQAVEIFQGDALSELVTKQTVDSIRGASTALLLASSRDEPASAPPDMEKTMFSSGLMQVLSEGIAGKGATLTLEDVGDAVRLYLSKNHGSRAARPEVHSPRQTGGDIARVPLFPNPRYCPPRKELPQHVLDTLQNPIPEGREIAVKQLGTILRGHDPELSDLARETLTEVAQNDDSRRIVKQAQQFLDGMLLNLAEMPPPVPLQAPITVKPRPIAIIEKRIPSVPQTIEMGNGADQPTSAEEESSTHTAPTWTVVVDAPVTKIRSGIAVVVGVLSFYLNSIIIDLGYVPDSSAAELIKALFPSGAYFDIAGSGLNALLVYLFLAEFAYHRIKNSRPARRRILSFALFMCVVVFRGVANDVIWYPVHRDRSLALSDYSFLLTLLSPASACQAFGYLLDAAIVLGISMLLVRASQQRIRTGIVEI